MPQDTSGCRVIDGGIDALTMTMKETDRDIETWYAAAADMLQLQIHAGNICEPAGRLGYRGNLCGGVFVGRRETDRIVQIQGPMAELAFHRCYTPASHVARIDIQITVQYAEYQAGRGREILSQLAKARELIPPKRRPLPRIVEDLDGGCTVYTNNRTAPAMGRSYDKGAQSDDPRYERCWRYEVELKNELATETAAILWERQSDIWTACRSMVGEWWERRGVTVPWSYTVPLVIPRIRSAAASDVEKKLRWLHEQVGPTVVMLERMGYTLQVNIALRGESTDASPNEQPKEGVPPWDEQ